MSAQLESVGGSPFEIDPALAQLLAQRRAARRVTPEDVAARVIAILEAAMRQPPPRALQLEEVAERMHVSSRTLKRHLQAAGLSFRPLLDRVRLSRAVEMLRGTSLPVEEIAVCVGYSSAANLSRALWRWSGVKPGDLRRGVFNIPALKPLSPRGRGVGERGLSWTQCGSGADGRLPPLSATAPCVALPRTSMSSSRLLSREGREEQDTSGYPSGLHASPGLSSQDKVAAGEDRDAAQSFED